MLAGAAVLVGCHLSLPVMGERAAIVVGPPRSLNDCNVGKLHPPTFLGGRTRNRDYRDVDDHPDLAGCREVCAPIVRPGEAVVGCYDAEVEPGEEFGCDGGTYAALEEIRSAERESMYCRKGASSLGPRTPMQYDSSDQLVVCQLSRVK
jgi:hypothetical protein